MKKLVLLVLVAVIAVGVWRWRLQPIPPVLPGPEQLEERRRHEEARANPQRTEALQAIAWEGRAHASEYDRCVSYPDLPENDWLPGSTDSRCSLLEPPQITVDDITSSLALRARREKLEFRFEQLRGSVNNRTDIRNHIVYQALSTPEAAATVDAWIAAMPGSRYARLGAGVRHAAAAERARGSASAAQTPEVSFQAMRAEAALAKPYLLGVLAEDTQLVPACTWAMRLGRVAGDSELVESGLRACSQHAPESFWFVREMFRLADPKWGGSPEALAQVAEYARTHAERNPLLATLAAEPEYLARHYSLEGADPVSIDRYRRMGRAGADPYVLAYAGKGLVEVGDINGDSELAWEGIAMLSQAIRFAPVEISSYMGRGLALGEYGQPELAAADFARVLSTVPLDFSVQRLWQRAKAAAAGGEPFTARDDDWMNEHRVCAQTIAAGDEEADACSETLILDYPQEPFAWWIRADALAALGDQSGEREALQRFLDLGDSTHPSHAVLAPQAKARLGR